MGEERPLGDPAKEFWTAADIAAYLGVTVETVRVYRSRGRGELPAEDDRFGQSPVWRPATIINHKRPGQGARTDLQDNDRKAGP
ncbi:MarR family transcriptional regulator [Actinomadura sp. KC06]|uniref:sigma-70 region 4 domain-containing protein n=1 Tax=Actinomadura sp. KC06 TaxID=2530369 RepID=UPI001052887B|nr:sigma-70 region 4 domain-containing protein [Actinomadura sp. KC06]TDD37870.1 MarR family transcriptional regulator [Actinomadura sp. KC06]